MNRNRDLFEWVYRKVIYLILQGVFAIAYLTTFIFSRINGRKKKAKEVKRIAAVWYNPKDLTGSNLRMGYWKHFFEKDGFVFDNYSILTIDDVSQKFENAKWSDKYLFYIKIIILRTRQFFKLKNYDVVWIDRGFLPYYPLKKALFERYLKRMVPYLIIDSTDGGDYLNNPQLIIDTFQQADRITVAFPYLEIFYKKTFENIYRINWTIPTENYLLKDDYNVNGKIVMGWMGSPANYKYLSEIKPALELVAKKYDFKLVYICRQDMHLEISGAEVEHHYFGNDYYSLINKFDVGLCPFLVENIRTKGKIAMKHQEFLLCGIPQVCSPVAISEHVRHGVEVFIAKNLQEWYNYLLVLIENKFIREEMGRNSINLFKENYTYEKEYENLKKALTEF